MKIQPVASPHDIKQAPPTDSRAKAIAAFNKASQVATQGQAQETPVQDPNNISVEELSAIGQVTEISDNSAELEASTEETVQETPKVDPAAEERFQKLARQERALRAKAQQQEQAFKQREAELKAREEALNANKPQSLDMSKYIERDRIKADALAALEEIGVTYDEVTQQAINRQPTDPRVMSTIQKLEAKIAQLEEANQNSQKTYAEQQQAQYKAAVQQITVDAKNLIKSDPVTYEAIAKTGSVKDVVDLIERTFEKDGIVLSVEEAAQEVENYLVEEAAGLYTKIDKLKKRIAQNSASSSQTGVKQQATQQKPQQMKTLTNATASTRQLSAKERAILAFKGELK